jgi:oxygen-independent coproporphyrinogen-3 oxidase
MQHHDPQQHEYADCWGPFDPSAPAPCSAYVHIPFCHHHCGYCNFSVLAGRDDLIASFLDALSVELRLLGNRRRVETIYIGGGTPTLLSIPQLQRAIEEIAKWLELDATGEFTIEANPNDLELDKVNALVALGCNRLSLGVQSFQPEKLRFLERQHTPSQARQAIAMALQCGKACVDLIFGVPGETLEAWQQDLEQAIESGAQHISTYGLTYEKGARFWSLQSQKRIQPVDEHVELDMYLAAIDRLTQAGYEHYEVSNFAKPGYRSRHNSVYWSQNRWWAFGPGAARFVGRTRSVNHRSTTSYIRRLLQGASAVAESELLTDEQMLREQTVFGLRQLQGIAWPLSTPTHLSRVQFDIETTIQGYCDQGWLACENDRLRLTRSGLVISDSLWPRLLED